MTLEDYWNQYYHGTPDSPSLLFQETETKKGWRQDVRGASAFRQYWSKRSPIYNLMHYYMNNKEISEDDALKEANVIFSSVPVSQRTKKRCLRNVKLAFQLELDRIPVPLEDRKYGTHKK